MSTDWHADEGLLARYVRGQAGPLAGASVEQHLTHCAECRSRIAGHVDPAPLEMVWDRIRDQAQVPRQTMVERLLIRLHVPESDALLIAVAPSLRTSWLVGLAVTLAFVGLAVGYGESHGLAVFLLLAPLIPVAGVGFSYGPDADPAYEVAVAVPYSGARLLLLRTAAVLAGCLPVVGLTALLIPDLSWTAVSWLVPALSFTAVTLAAATWTRPAVAASGLAIAWICAVGASAVTWDAAAVLAPPLLLAYAAVGFVAVLVFRLRIHHLAPLGSLS